MKMELTVGTDVDQFIKALEDFTNATDDMLRWTVYPGAKLTADKIRKAIEDLPEIKQTPRETKSSGGVKRPRKSGKSSGKKPKGATKVEREGMLEGLGVAGMRYDGDFLNAKIGMDGYNKHITTKWPKGHPNAMVARSIESGTSFRQKCPFVAPTVRQYKLAAEQEMAKEFDRQVEKHWTYR